MRVELAALYRLVALHGWDDMIFTHISARVPGPEHHFLINPYGLMFDEITASSLVKVDGQCNKVVDSPFPVNPAGFNIHSAVHEVRDDVGCVMHTHTTAGMAVSSVEGGLQPVNFYACNFAGQIAYHDFEGVTVRDEEGERLLAHLGSKRAMLLKNHGILVMGRTLPEAFIKHWSLQRACEIQVATMSMGKPLVVPDEVVAVHQRDLYMAQASAKPGEADFAAMVRKVDKIDTSWRN